MHPLRRALRFLLLLAPLALATCGGSERPSPPPGAPNIVLISIDTLNPSGLRMDSPDADIHPVLDALAERSVRFRRAISAAAWTLPSHASMLTGLYPDRHGATDPRRRIAPEVRTLAQDLHDAGYETVAFTDAGYVDRRYGFGDGFTIYNDTSNGATVNVASLPRAGAPNPLRGSTLFDRAIAYLEKRRGKAPLFLFVHTYCVHDYFRMHPWALRDAPWNGGSIDENLKILLGEKKAPPEVWDHLRALYAAEIDHTDEALGHFFEAIGASGLAPNTIVAFVSDHGEGFDPDAGRIHHGGKLLRFALRVPFLIAGPGVQEHDVATPVSLVDLTPTLLDLAGVSPPADLDGRSLAAAVRDSTVEPAERPLFAMEHYHRWVNGVRLAAPDVQSEPLAIAVIDGPDWFVAEAGEDGTVEHRYDVAADPDQRDDLGAEGTAAASLRELIRQRLRPLPETQAVEPDSALQAQLRSLGYVH